MQMIPVSLCAHTTKQACTTYSLQQLS